MNKIAAIFFLISIFSWPSLSNGQNPIKEIFKTHYDGSPEIVNYYNGDKRQANKLKTEKYDHSGRKTLEENFKDGKLHGKQSQWEHYDNNSPNLIREDNYHLGLLHGQQTVWTTKGKVIKQFNYSMGKPEGKQLEMFDENRTRFELNFKDGKPEGIQKEWFDSGSMLYEMNFVDGKPEGLQRFWDYSGTAMEQIWENGIFTKELEQNGKKAKEEYIFVLDSTKLSLNYNYFNSNQFKLLLRTTTFHDNGKPATEQTHGKDLWYKAWYDNGQLKTEGAGKDFDQKGKWVEFYQNGQKAAEGNYEKRRKVGSWNTWNEKGWLLTEEVYEWAGIKEKKFHTYHPNGKKESTGYLQSSSSLRYDRKDKTWEYWYIDGKKRREESYEPGPYSGNRPFIKSFVEWYPDGKVKIEGEDKKASHYFYGNDGNKIATIQLVYKKTRGLHAYVEKGELKINKNYAQNRGGGKIMTYEFEEGFPTQLDIHYPSGKNKSTFRYCIDCAPDGLYALHGIQEGWDEKGLVRYKFNFEEGCMLGQQQEWRADGSPLYLIEYAPIDKKVLSDDICQTHCLTGTYYTTKGKVLDYVHEWESNSLKKATESGDFSQLKSEEKSKKIIEVENEGTMQEFLRMILKE